MENNYNLLLFEMNLGWDSKSVVSCDSAMLSIVCVFILEIVYHKNLSKMKNKIKSYLV